eukprot:CAMPEP_0177638204 /NCGR_PEP_ID=MMETSP0447-20121125/5366_1 /TAXON_ID=0 /ORGANISM="Stygamoeba regulata, Strain BSH-02190019" /LENGTH=224 /DNA_ID=CAMNT_0019140155 /DNA_START=54 /DNA_END=728 /DNA_ORIENTATION=+
MPDFQEEEQKRVRKENKGKSETQLFRENADILPPSFRLRERGVSQQEVLESLRSLPEGVGESAELQEQLTERHLKHLPPTPDQSQYPPAETSVKSATAGLDGTDSASWQDPLFAVRRAHELHGESGSAGALVSAKTLGVFGGLFCPAFVRGLQKQRLVRAPWGYAVSVAVGYTMGSMYDSWYDTQNINRSAAGAWYSFNLEKEQWVKNAQAKRAAVLKAHAERE